MKIKIFLSFLIIVSIITLSSCKKSDPFSNSITTSQQSDSENTNKPPTVNSQNDETWASKLPYLWSITAYAQSGVDPKTVTYEQFLEAVANKLATDPRTKGLQGVPGPKGADGVFRLSDIPFKGLPSEKLQDNSISSKLHLAYERKWYSLDLTSFKVVHAEGLGIAKLNFASNDLPNWIFQNESTSMIAIGMPHLETRRPRKNCPTGEAYAECASINVSFSFFGICSSAHEMSVYADLNKNITSKCTKSYTNGNVSSLNCNDIEYDLSMGAKIYPSFIKLAVSDLTSTLNDSCYLRNVFVSYSSF